MQQPQEVNTLDAPLGTRLESIVHCVDQIIAQQQSNAPVQPPAMVGIDKQ